MPRRRIHLPVAMGLAWGLQGRVSVLYRMRSADAVLPLTPVDMFAAPRRKEGKYGTTTYCSS